MTKSIASLLAFAVTTSIALAHGGGGEGEKNGGEKRNNPYQSGQVMWKPGSGITLADSDEFKLNMMGIIQAQYGYGSFENGPNVNSFDVRRARLNLMGHVFSPDLEFRLMMDATDDGAGLLGGLDGPVREAHASWRLLGNEDYSIKLRAGQSKPFFGLESTGFETGLMFVERSNSSRAFAEARSQGAWLLGSAMDNSLRWVAGIQNGTVSQSGNVPFGPIPGEETPNLDQRLNYVFAVAWDVLGDMMNGGTGEFWMQGDLEHVEEVKGTIGASLSLENNVPAPAGTNIEGTAFNLNTAWLFGGGLSAQAEFFSRTDDPGTGDLDSTGFYVAGHYTLPKSADSDIQWGFAVRYDMIDTDTGAALPVLGLPALSGPGDVSELGVAVNAFYHGHSAKTQLEYAYQDASPDTSADSTNHLVRLMFTLAF